MARDLSAALTLATQVAEIGARGLSGAFGGLAALLVPTRPTGWRRPSPDNDRRPDVGRGAMGLRPRRKPVRGTDTLPAQRLLYLPLQAPMRVRGVLP
jgi:two-component system sensor histidine kinase KdpD